LAASVIILLCNNTPAIPYTIYEMKVKEG